MSVSLSGWSWVVIAVLGLVGLARIRRPLESIDVSGYRATFAGGMLFTLAALLGIYRDLVPAGFLANATNELLCRLAESIGILTGAAFMVSGGTHLLLASIRRQTERIAAVEHLVLLKEVEQLVQVESRPQIMLREALFRMCRFVGANEGRVYVKSTERGMAIAIAESAPSSGYRLPDEIQCVSDSDNEGTQISGRMNGVDCLIVPVLVNNRPIAMFGLLPESAVLPEGTLSLLNMSANVIARRIERDANRLTIQHQWSVSQFREALDQKIADRSSLRDQLSVTRQELIQFVRAEVCTLVTVDLTRQTLTRCSVSAPGAYLEERDLPIPPRFAVLVSGIPEAALLPSGEDESIENLLSLLVPGDPAQAVVHRIDSQPTGQTFFVAGTYGAMGLRSTDMDFVTVAARKIQRTMQVSAVNRNVVQPTLPLGFKSEVDSRGELRSHVKSTLAGILGSVELMRSSEALDNQSMERYLGIIDRSAQRLRRYVEPEDYTSVTEQPEQVVHE